MCDSNFEHADWFVSLFFCDVASLLKNSQFWECFSLCKVLYIQLWTRCGFTLSCLVWFSVSKYTFVKINSWNSPLSSNLILNLIFFFLLCMRDFCFLSMHLEYFKLAWNRIFFTIGRNSFFFYSILYSNCMKLFLALFKFDVFFSYSICLKMCHKR